MRATLFVSFAVLGVLRLAASVPHGLASHDTPAVLPGGSVTSPPESSYDCRNASSASQKRPPQVIREKTVITIERILEIEPLDDQGCPCSCDLVRRCRACLNCEKEKEADTSSPSPNPETQTSASTQRTTVPVTVPSTTPKPQTTGDTQRTTVPVTVPTTTPEPQTTAATQRTTVTVTVPTTTPEPQTTAATQRTTVPVPVPTTTPEPQTTAATQRTTVPVTAPTTTPEPQTTARTPGPTVSATLPTTTQRPPVTRPSKECNPDNCKPPSCTCMSPKPPVKDMPQFVMLSFDDAVTSQNMPFYRELLGDLKRKNKASGCHIAATFFASAEYLDYPSVNELYNGGNEIALHSISHKTGSDYWNSLDTAGWEKEFLDQRRMMEMYAKVPAKDVRGIRGPFFFTGADAGFRMLHSHFDYDCTLIHHRASPADLPVFPYTMDFGFQENCMVKNCPQDAYPGLWLMPLNTLLRGKEMGGGDDYMQCAMLDACLPQPTTSNDTFHYLKANFENFYNTNRAPMPVFVHEAWLKDLERKEGYLRFVDWLLEKEDVHLVTVSEVLDFMRNPRPKSSYVQRHCPKSPLSHSTCPQTTTCHYTKTPLRASRYMRICGTTCPKSYPWVGNPEGN